MSGKRWWEDPNYPVRSWTATDRAQALKQGWKPPIRERLPKLDATPLIAPEHLLGVPESDEAYRDRQRHNAANAILCKHGIEPR